MEFYRLYDLEKKEFFHDRLVYASLEEAAGEIRKNRSAHPSLRAIRFQAEITKKGIGMHLFVCRTAVTLEMMPYFVLYNSVEFFRYSSYT
ncbi:hypothetical protein PLACP1_16130 [Planifilum fimeticola]